MTDLDPTAIKYNQRNEKDEYVPPEIVGEGIVFIINSVLAEYLQYARGKSIEWVIDTVYLPDAELKLSLKIEEVKKK